MSYQNSLEAAAAAFASEEYIQVLTILTKLIDHAETAAPFSLLGETLEKMELIDEAATAFEQAASLDSQASNKYLRRAATLHFTNGSKERAISHAIKLIQSDRSDVEAAYILASALSESGDQSIVDLVKNTLVDSENISHLELAAKLIGADSRNENNVKLYGKLRKIYPFDQGIRFRLLDLAREHCAYEVLEAEEALLKTEILAGRTELLIWEAPHTNLMWCDHEDLNIMAQNVRDVDALEAGHAERRRLLPHGWSKEKIRIGYLSSDFWDQHATMKLLQRVLELHDASRFDVILFCHTPCDFIAADEGNRSNWGKIISILDLDKEQAANVIRAHEIDILVDLKGHTGGSRSAILNLMVAPIQVAWLGFPGSSRHIDCDYIIGDHIVLPDSSKPFYHEKFCRLPDTYQPNDPVHRPLPQVTTRSEWGLPEEGFIFAAFYSIKKLSVQTLNLWIRVLNRVPNSILWVMCDSALARGNILRKLSAGGIAPERVVFASKVKYERHISRLALADLALDTFPYNGHTTTSDNLWAGLPVVTARGANFASRVSESLLMAAALPDLVANDHDAYCDLAVTLANNPKRLEDIRSQLMRGRHTLPLFDADRFRKHLENAYENMVDRAQRGLPPDHFDVLP